jgi:hypothetical protein
MVVATFTSGQPVPLAAFPAPTTPGHTRWPPVLYFRGVPPGRAAGRSQEGS